MADVNGYTLPGHEETYMYADAKVRSYGYGETNGQACSDANAATVIGHYSMSGSGALNVPAGFEYGQLSVTRRNADVYQTLKSENNEVYRHSSDGGTTWQPWSISRGVDVVVEQGTSGEWIYRKWASGIAECWGVFKDGTLSTTQEGSLYYALTTAKAYPFTFTENPYVQVSPAADGNGYCMILSVNEAGTTSQTPIYALGRPNNAAIYNSGLHFYVIGKWK